MKKQSLAISQTLRKLPSKSQGCPHAHKKWSEIKERTEAEAARGFLF